MAKLLRSRPGARDEGFTMVMTIMVVAVVFTLGATWVAYADHQSSSSSYDRRRQQAIDSANAGLVVADSALSQSSSYIGVGVTSFPGGSAQYEVSVANGTGAFQRVITATGYAPSKTATDRVTRTVRQVVDLDPLGFEYAMFSQSSIVTGSSSVVIGDVYAVTNITLGNSQNFVGDIYALGTVTTGSHQSITGTVRANGSVSVANTSSNVYGSVYSRGSITTGGTVRDIAHASQAVSDCAKVTGSCIQYQPPPAVPTQQLPTYTFNESIYTAKGYTVSYMTGSAFVNAYSKVDMQGVFRLTGDVTFKNNDSLYLTGDTVIVASGNITLPRTIENRSSSGSTVQLSVISTGGGTITPSNNFTIPTTVKTLLFTTGLFDAKNSSTFTGALYAGQLDGNAKTEVTYATLDDTGFDWTNANPQSFTIRNVSTREILNGT